MLYSFQNEAASFRLKINSEKTKSMSIVNSYTTRQSRPNAIVVNAHPVEEVNQFTYLGTEICKDSGSDADVDCRVRKAKGEVNFIYIIIHISINLFVLNFISY